jgi:hypothetical protein
VWSAEGEDGNGKKGEPSRKRKLERSVWVEQHKFCMNFELIKSWWLILYDFFIMLVDIFHDFLCC